MKKIFYSFYALVMVVAFTVSASILSSCTFFSNTPDSGVTVNLPDSLEVVGSMLTGANPEIMIRGCDVYGSWVIACMLRDNKTDTIFRNDGTWLPCQVAKTKSGYVIACRDVCSQPMNGSLYAVFLTNAKDKHGKKLLIDSDDEDLIVEGYVINTVSETIELSSTDEDSDNVLLYNVVYDFSGNQIANNSRKISIVKKTSISTNAFNSFGQSCTYLWKCTRCGAMRNGQYNSGGMCNGTTYPHEWVKIQRVD